MLPVFSLFSLLSGAGWAAPFDSGSQDAELSVEQQLTRDRLLTQFDAHFFPERVEDIAMLERIEMTEEHRGFSCLTGLVRDLKDNWELFSVQERAEMTGILAPWKRDLLESSPPPPSNADSPCVNPSDGYVDDRDNQVLGDHFSVEWDSGANQTKAENFLESLEFSWEMQIDEWDWEEPTGTSRYPMLAYIAQGNYASAYTTVDWCSGQGWVPYIVAFAGSFSSGNWYQDMAGHEFNHAVQYAYGYAHEFWWWEATATWVEEYVYDSHNSWSDYVWGYSENPWIALNSSSQSDTDIFYHMYGMAQLGFYLDQHVGGHEMVRGTWEVAAEDGGTYSLWLPDAIEDMGYDWSEIYT
ncbi:MAG: hypothetical protein QGG40_02055 [Myxococcota bacterium]|nr:hypothetical protein [Myxococcota bacterium]